MVQVNQGTLWLILLGVIREGVDAAPGPKISKLFDTRGDIPDKKGNPERKLSLTTTPLILFLGRSRGSLLLEPLRRPRPWPVSGCGPRERKRNRLASSVPRARPRPPPQTRDRCHTPWVGMGKGPDSP